MMNKTAKIALLVATLWPPVYMILFFAWIFGSFITMSAQGSASGHPGSAAPPGFAGGIGWLFAAHLLTMLWIMALTVFYIVDVFKNPRLGDKRALWAVVIFFGAFIAMPVYWYLNIWRDGGPNSSSAFSGSPT